MGIGKNQGRQGNHHELDAAAGFGDNKLQVVVHIACMGKVFKGVPAENAGPPGGGGQYPHKAAAVDAAVIQL